MRTSAAGGAAAQAADRLARFEDERPRLVGLAYRMLGVRADAEDVVQDAWLRWDRSGGPADDVANPAAWLTTVVSRLALDRLRSRQRDRTTYVGPWLPEPLLVARDPADDRSSDPAEVAVRNESLSLGFLHVLERLSPRERVAFVLTEVFDESHERAGAVVGATATASRQLVHRARRKLADERPPDALASAQLADVVDAFVAACATGEIDALLRVLAPDVVLVSDGGAERHAARRPVIGPHRVGRLLAYLMKRLPEGCTVERTPVNGAPGLVVRWSGAPVVVLAFEASPAGVRRVRMVLAPDKVADVDRPVRLV